MDKKHLKKPVILIVSFSLIFLFAAGSTLAFLIREAAGFETIFLPGSVQCEIIETDDGYTVKNTGNAGAYIRAAIVPNWTKDGRIYGAQPITAEHYEVVADRWTETDDGEFVCETFAASESGGEETTVILRVVADGWAVTEEGYLVCKTAVQPETETPPVILIIDEEASAPGDCELKIEFLAEAIQNTPAEAVEKAWGIPAEKAWGLPED